MTTENPNAAAIRINASTIKVVFIVLAFCGGLGGGIWTAAAWKTSVDEHLQRMEDHMHDEDDHIKEEREQLQWLIKHNKDSADAPTSWQAPLSRLDPPLVADQAPQEAVVPGLDPN